MTDQHVDFLFFSEQYRSQFMGMNAFERHKRLINDYVRYYSQGKTFDEVFKRDK